MRKFALAWACVLAVSAFADVASNVYTVVENGGTRALPVGIETLDVEVYDASTGQTTTKPFGEVSFAANSIFRKRGSGFVLSSLAMSSFTGEIRIEEGALVINTNNQIGVTTVAASAPLVVVSNGASFVMATRKNTCAAKSMKLHNRFVIAGDGVDGIGAICNDNETDQTDYLFYSPWILSDDASVGCTKSSRFDFGGVSIDLAGHNLTVHGAGGWGTMLFANNSRFLNSDGTPVKVLVNGHAFQLQGVYGNSGSWDGGAENELVFTNSAWLKTYGTQFSEPWTMRICGGTAVSVFGSGSSSLSLGLERGNRLYGPVVLDDATARLKLTTDSSNDGDGVFLGGLVSGSGGLLVANALAQLAYATNTFTGPVLASTDSGRKGGLALWHSRSLPPESAGLVSSNTQVKLVAKDERFELPPVEFHVREGSNVSFNGGMGGTTPAFRKTGAGRLDISAPLTVTGRMEIAEGTVKMARYFPAGLIAGRFQMQNQWWIQMPGDTNRWGSLGNAARYSACTLTNEIQTAPVCFTTSRSDFGHIPADAPSTQGGAGLVIMYNGYIWNRTGETQRWTFGGSFGTHCHVFVDGQMLYGYYTYNTGKWKTIDVAPGPHTFRVGSYASGQNAYCDPNGSSFTNMTWKIGSASAGLRYDPLGRDSTNCAQYVPIEDPGDGSLLTVSTNDTVTAVLDKPSFHALRLAAGTTFDVFGNGIVAGDLEGLGTITNSNSYNEHPFTVTNSWKVCSEDVAAGGVLKSSVPLVFADGVSFVAEDLAHFPRAIEPLVICEANAPIVGMPAFDRMSNATTRKWKLSKSDDGRKLMFSYKSGAVVIFQ